MKIRELIAEFQKFDPDFDVLLINVDDNRGSERFTPRVELRAQQNEKTVLIFPDF